MLDILMASYFKLLSNLFNLFSSNKSHFVIAIMNFFFKSSLLYFFNSFNKRLNSFFISESTGYMKIKNYQNIEIDNIYDFYKAEVIFKKKKLNSKL